MTITTTKLKSGKYMVTAYQTDGEKFMAISESRKEACSKAVRGCYQYVEEMRKNK